MHRRRLPFATTALSLAGIILLCFFIFGSVEKTVWRADFHCGTDIDQPVCMPGHAGMLDNMFPFTEDKLDPMRTPGITLSAALITALPIRLVATYRKTGR